MKIYLVTDGSYSDFQVRAAYSTREGAELAQRYHNWNDQIEEFELNPGIPEHPHGMSVFQVRMQFDGAVDFDSHISGDHVAAHPKEGVRPPWCKSTPTVRLFVVWAEDSKHAIKIVNERRIALIASGDWKE